MEPYTQFTDRDILQIAALYDIEKVENFRPLSGGLENTNYVLHTNNGSFVLTLCERKSYEEAKILADLLAHLAEHQFFTTKIKKNKKGEQISFFQGKPILLKSFFEGTVTDDLGLEHLEQIGLNMGRLHLVPPPNFVPQAFSYGVQTFQQVWEANISHSFVNWLTDMEQYIRIHLHPSLPKGLIHGDIFDNNIVLIEEERPVIIDLEEACHYYLIYDLGMAIVGLCTKMGKLILPKVQVLINAYQTIRPLSAHEQENLQAFTVYAATATAFWRFRQFNILLPGDARKDHYQEMQALADEIQGLREDEWIF